MGIARCGRGVNPRAVCAVGHVGCCVGGGGGYPVRVSISSSPPLYLITGTDRAGPALGLLRDAAGKDDVDSPRALQSTAWQLSLLLKHYHPTVSSLARVLANSEPLKVCHISYVYIYIYIYMHSICTYIYTRTVHRLATLPPPQALPPHGLFPRPPSRILGAAKGVLYLS